jgi:hypothetical protein
MEYLVLAVVGAAEFASSYVTMNWLLRRWSARRDIRRAVEALV